MLDLHCDLKKKPSFKQLKKMNYAKRHELKMITDFLEENKQKTYTFNEIKHILGIKITL